jgi:cysteine desulfurase
MSIYLDNSATTQVDPRVAEAMAPWHTEAFGNPSSLHAPGRRAREAVEIARAQVAALLGGRPREIVFTGSGTEADNLALIGAIGTAGPEPRHLIVSAIEHPAILDTARALERRGVDVTLVPVDGAGRVDPEAVRQCLRPNTRLVSVMAANNVIGTLQPVSEIAQIARVAGVLFHTDAVQAVGKLPFDLAVQPIDLLSLSAHKLHGPKGVGALYVRDGVALAPIIHGGGQEHGLRSATENVAGIVGLGRAAELAAAEMVEDNARLVQLRDRLVTGILAACPQAYLIGDPLCRLPGHVCLGFAGQEGEAIRLLLALDEAGIAVSTGSACSASHAAEPSYVLQALGFDAFRSRGALRLTLGRFNTATEVERVVEVLPRLVTSLRRIATSRH